MPNFWGPRVAQAQAKWLGRDLGLCIYMCDGCEGLKEHLGFEGFQGSEGIEGLEGVAGFAGDLAALREI